MNWKNNGIIAIVVSLLFLSCSSSEKKKENDLTLFVAASLTDVITEITNQFTNETGIKIKMNLASSGTLARQLSQGASADLYFSASEKWMDYAESEGLVDTSSTMTPAKNILVLVAPKETVTKPLTNFEELKSETERISIGDPAHVPAGKYAVSAMQSLGIYSAVENKLLPAKDVRSALMVVELGECNYGVVYKTDALKSKKVDIVKTFPENSHAPIVYFGSICQSSKKTGPAQKLLAYINGKASLPVWKKYGFVQP